MPLSGTMNAVVSVAVSAENFRNSLLNYIQRFSNVLFLDSNTPHSGPVPVTGIRYDFLAAIGIHCAIADAPENDASKINDFIEEQRKMGRWVFGHLSYDFKNRLEELQSENPASLNFPESYFFVPEILVLVSEGQAQIHSFGRSAAAILQEIENAPAVEEFHFPSPQLLHAIDKKKYLETLNTIHQHLGRGDIYEMNFCHEVIAGGALQPLSAYRKLTALAPNPFAAFYRLNDHYLICSSPERFICRNGDRVLSQPIKGTAPRGENPVSDLQYKEQLLGSEKERSENVMIVDLVRNDLSRVALKSSVVTDELFGVYTFPKVHQMISTVSCSVNTSTTFMDIVRATFPMGSMTGAPKIRAMQLIEKCEDFRRGLFSGTVGYISPDGDFDFNVVIRSIQYNAANNIIALAAGGAITFNSIPENEYEETILKLAPQLAALGISRDMWFKFINSKENAK